MYIKYAVDVICVLCGVYKRNFAGSYIVMVLLIVMHFSSVCIGFVNLFIIVVYFILLAKHSPCS